MFVKQNHFSSGRNYKFCSLAIPVKVSGRQALSKRMYVCRIVYRLTNVWKTKNYNPLFLETLYLRPQFPCERIWFLKSTVLNRFWFIYCIRAALAKSFLSPGRCVRQRPQVSKLLSLKIKVKYNLKKTKSGNLNIQKP